ncbi:MAG: tetratricopeptide repeat protein [Bacteroidota bacterium]
MKTTLRLLVTLFPSILAAQSLDDGVALLQKGKTAEARKVFEGILKIDDKNAEAHYRLSQVFLIRSYDERSPDEAADHAEEAVDLKPDNADYQYMLGVSLGEKAQHANFLSQAFLAPKIKRAFARAVELDPKHVQAHIGLANYYIRAPGIMGGDTEKGWKELDAVVQLDEFIGRMQKARFYERDNKLAEAENELKTLVQSDPKDWRRWKNLGYFYLRSKNPDGAIASFRKYVGLRADTADSHDSLAEAQFEKRDYDGALASTQKALALDNNFSSAVLLNARICEATGQKKEAVAHYQRLLSMNIQERQRKEIEKKLNELQ